MLKLSIKLSYLKNFLVILSILPAGSVTHTQGPVEAENYTEHLQSRLLSPGIFWLTGAQQCYIWAKAEAKNLDNTLKCWLTKG